MKPPKRYQNKPIPTMPEDSEPDWYELNTWCQRAKRKNRVKQLKNTISRLTAEAKELNTSRIILRNYLIHKRNYFIIQSRKAATEQERKNFLAATLSLNLFISLSYTSAEGSAERNGQDPIPHAIKFTDEEKNILHTITEQEEQQQH